MNLPNKLTFIRLVLAVPFIYFLQESNAEGFVYRMIAFALFVVASLTDFFDGYLARKYNLVTDFENLWIHWQTRYWSYLLWYFLSN